jgi:phosphatidylglycerophosphate synthase
MTTIARRELATRHAVWARRLAAALAAAGATPNTVSLASVVCAAGTATAFALAPRVDAPQRALLLLLAAAGIQLRLLCNLLDGMLAVEEGLQTQAGALFNEIPDRIADVVILAAAGCASPAPAGVALGWIAALAAMFTAYVRQLGGSLTGSEHFIGPMAKQHRMFVLTLASLAGAVQTIAGGWPSAVAGGLALITAGSLVTAARRIGRIARDLEER